jgi:hypothetical protein
MKRSRILTVATSGFTIAGLIFGLVYSQIASAAVPGINQLTNQDQSGNYGNSITDGSATGEQFLSGDGRYTLFTSAASNLVASDANGGYWDAFRRDNQSGAVILVSVNTAGTQGNDSSYAAGISNDGRYVLFKSYSTNLISNYGYIPSLYRRDLTTGTTSYANNPSQTQTVRFASISADGRYVSFSSKKTAIGGGLEQVYVKDMDSGTIKSLSVDASNNLGTTNDSFGGGMNCSGNIIAFASAATNLPNNANTTHRSDLFIAETGWGSTKLTNITQIPGSSTQTVKNVSVSCDGNTVAYSIGSSSSYSVYKYNRLTGANTLASVKTSGVGTSSANTSAISGDGRYIAFTAYGSGIDSAYPSTNALNAEDVYVRDTVANTTQLVSFTSSGNQSGRVSGAYRALAISADGKFVAYVYKTPESTVPGSALISGLTTGTGTARDDGYISQTGF